MIVFNSTTGVLNQYISGAWTTFASGTTANAANGTGGKVDLATAAENAAGTANDASSGSPNVIPTSIVKATSSGAVSGTVPMLNTSVMLDGSIGGTGIASPVLGALLIGSAANGPMTAIGPGTSGQVPISNGTTLAMGTVGDGKRLRLMARQFAATTSPTGASALTTDNSSSVDLEFISFDTTTEENAFTQFTLPSDYTSGATITAQIYWTNAAGSTPGETVAWAVSAVAMRDNIVWGATAYGTQVVTSDTALADFSIHVSPVSTAITIAGSPVAGDLVSLLLTRKTGTDNMVGDAQFLGMVLIYT